LRYFTSGKLPKAFKILPSLRNWEKLLYLTRPDRWSPVVTRLATFLFSRGMTDKLVQRFYYIILLPKIREEIHSTRKVNFHYYLALKACFFPRLLFYVLFYSQVALEISLPTSGILQRYFAPSLRIWRLHAA
jgi:essential nuclear protein 1